MNRRLTALFAAAGLLIAVGVSMAQPKSPRERRSKTVDKNTMVGQEAPDFKLVDLEDNTVSLKALRGQIVVLEWTNKDCPIWVKKMSELASAHEEAMKLAQESTNEATKLSLEGTNKQIKVTWLAIDSTNHMEPSEVREYMKEHKITRPVLDDRSGTVGHAYNARTTPHMFIIDQKGKIVYDGAIDNQKEGKEHVNYVTKALKELAAGKPVSEPTTKPYGCSVKYKSKSKK